MPPGPGGSRTSPGNWIPPGPILIKLPSPTQIQHGISTEYPRTFTFDVNRLAPGRSSSGAALDKPQMAKVTTRIAFIMYAYGFEYDSGQGCGVAFRFL